MASWFTLPPGISRSRARQNEPLPVPGETGISCQQMGCRQVRAVFSDGQPSAFCVVHSDHTIRDVANIMWNACNFGECLEERFYLRNSSFCPLHECDVNGCRDLSIQVVKQADGSYGMIPAPYCARHTYNPHCIHVCGVSFSQATGCLGGPPHPYYCAPHTCAYITCNYFRGVVYPVDGGAPRIRMSGLYCTYHRCRRPGCERLRCSTPSAQFCQRHECSRYGCLREIGTPGASVEDEFFDSERFCNRHRCFLCPEGIEGIPALSGHRRCPEHPLLPD